MPRNRPERKRSQWAEIKAATTWYTNECDRRGIPRDEALEWWENLTITARIRRWKTAIAPKPWTGNELESQTPLPLDALQHLAKTLSQQLGPEYKVSAGAEAEHRRQVLSRAADAMKRRSTPVRG